MILPYTVSYAVLNAAQLSNLMVDCGGAQRWDTRSMENALPGLLVCQLPSCHGNFTSPPSAPSPGLQWTAGLSRMTGTNTAHPRQSTHCSACGDPTKSM